MEVFRKDDMFKAESQNGVTSIGKMIQSINLNAPQWQFGKSNRTDTQKMYISKPLLKNQLIDQDPNRKQYYPLNELKYKKDPLWSFSKDSRFIDQKAKYSHFMLNDKNTDPIKAFKDLHENRRIVRFKSAPKVN